MTTISNVLQVTEEAMADPQPGDVFHEMYSYIVTVLGRDGETVTWLAGGAGQWWPEHASRFTGTCDQFRRMHSYDSMPDRYTVFLLKRGTDVTGLRAGRYLEGTVRP